MDGRKVQCADPPAAQRLAGPLALALLATALTFAALFARRRSASWTMALDRRACQWLAA